jgi:hypothetical protein
MDNAVLAPRLKAQIKDALIEFLYTPVERSMKRRLNELIVANTLAGKYSCKSFHYKGQQYHCEDGPPPRNWNKLLPQFKSQMDEWLADFKRIEETERPFIFGFLNQVLNSSNHLADYYALLPDSAHPPIKALKLDDPLHPYPTLSPERINQIIAKSPTAIQMMKARMVTNLLI